ncbi:SNF2 domain-containing protein CLASSY 4-like [Vicia villosa]|uniref:SNF2 domain-containing protein CLASSY 4-like n=1 Tax=Vicia villosa TaxID=3911 RepID=UPI00273BEA6A|nr:SNF2 domain-containing protein CLASSY 4-like [Vicia villosa]XP_058747517.1 SNF2 domain-containing protein CLASSY 4-like [Vicia villosa]
MAGVSSRTRSTLAGVSGRTRSKNVPLFGSLSFHGLFKSKRRKSDTGLGSKKRKPNEESLVLHEQVKLISEGCVEQVQNVDVEDCERNNFEGCVGVEKEVEKEKSGGIGELAEKDEIFDDEKGGLLSEKLIIDPEDESDDDDDDSEDESDDDGDDDDGSEESEEIETSDEEYQVDEVNEVSDSDDSGTYVDDDDSGEEKEERTKSWKKKEEKKKGSEEEEEKMGWEEEKKMGWKKEEEEKNMDREEERKMSWEEKNMGLEEEEERKMYWEETEEVVVEEEEKKMRWEETEVVVVVEEEEEKMSWEEKEDEVVVEEEEKKMCWEETEVVVVVEEERKKCWEETEVVVVEEKKKCWEETEVVVVEEDEKKMSWEEKEEDEKKMSWEEKEEEKKMCWEETEELVVEEEKEADLDMIWQEYSNGLAEMGREANGQGSANNDELEHAYEGNVRSSNALKKKGSFVPMEAPSSKLHQAPETLTSKGLQMKVRNVSDDDDNVYVGKTISKSKSKSKESVVIGDCVEEKMQSFRGIGVGDESDSCIQTQQKKVKASDKQQMMEMKESIYKGRANTHSGGKNKSTDQNGSNQRGKSTVFRPKELRLVELLAEYYWGNKNNKIKNDSPVLEIKDVIRQDTRPPPVCNETTPLIWSLKKAEKVQKTKNEEEEEVLWDQMDTSLRELEAESMIGNLGTNEATQEKIGSPSSDCEHDIYLDEEIGVYCRRCGWVVTDIKDVSPQVVDKFPYEGSGQRALFGDANVAHFHGSHFNVSDHDSETNFSCDERTVWDLIPDVKQTLYSHQQEGFEFIWNKLVGNMELRGLKNTNLQREGGCIISHAPGTGKTKLTIMFLKAYLKVFPKCLPVIVAPAGLLLTWEDEFKKWDIGVPFHNLNNPELSVKEHDDVVNATDWSNTGRHSKDETRMAKLISWFKETSILGISYTLFQDLAYGEVECTDKKKNKHAKGWEWESEDKKYNKQKRKENSYMRKALLEAPGLLVLDEGHTPRNARSLVWKVLSKVQTKKRIMLSGTPFQNNFLELYNTFSIVKPSFPNTIPPKLKKFCQKHKKAAKEEWSWEPVTGNSTTGNTSDDKIKHLKLLMAPFVHVYKGAILQKKLFGLRECVLRLKPDRFQKQILEGIKSSQNILKFEHKLILASVHPSLFLECKLLEEEEAVVDKEQLEKLRLNPNIGVKTKFLVEFVNLCVAVNEKVLVFSQFIPPLRLIVEQLNSIFNWAEGKEILYMDGNIDLKEKQSIIHNFNDANSKAKILLACTKACSEGISLVGASRVVLLDVVWNPSVERQAISRAYRIGQKRVVYTYHLLTHETTECVKYFKQAEKDRLSELVFSDNHMGKNRAANFKDGILDLMLQHEKLKDMFVECVVQPKERDLVESFYY